MVKHIFPPEGFATPYSTVPLTTLSAALICKRLSGTSPQNASKKIPHPFTGRMVQGRDPTPKRVQDANQECAQHILDDLQSGSLIAHAHSEATGQFRKIPPSFWFEEYPGLPLSGTLFGLKEGATFPKEIAGATIYVSAENAKAWLSQQAITETDHFFPQELRAQKKIGPALRKKKYDWEAFEDEAVKLMHDEGAFSGDWIQARLEEQMQVWCVNNWGKEPSLRSMRDHVKSAINRFHIEKKGTLGSLGS